MVTSQIKYVVETLLKDQTNEYTFLKNLHYLVIDKYERKYSDDKTLFYFDTDLQILYIYPCRLVDKVPNHNNYEVINNKIYELLINKDKKVLKDCYAFNEITSFTLR